MDFKGKKGCGIGCLGVVIIVVIIVIIAVAISPTPSSSISNSVSSTTTNTTNSNKANISQPQEEQVTLSNGNYTAGKDFVAGEYNVIATSGSGNVYDSDGAINQVMSPETDSSAGIISEFKNVTFTKGDVLTVSDVTIKLVPVSNS